MPTAIEMQELPKARPWLPPATVSAAHAPFGEEPGLLQRLFHVGVRQGDAVISPDHLVEMTAIEPGVALAIQL